MFHSISIREVDHYIDDNKDFMLIDLRSQQLYRKSHIMRAVNYPFEKRNSWIKSLPKDKLLLFYCQRGVQSMMICRYLEANGYHVINIANGFFYYRGKYRVQG